jgi:RNA polymerase sigma-70 factor (ECF subfamily)
MMLGTTARRAVPISDDADHFDVRSAFQDHGRALYVFAYNSTRDGGLAEDCVQETFVRAWRARDTYRSGRGSERTWLFAIARHVVIDQVRARQRRPTPVTDDHLQSSATTVSETGSADDRMVLYSGLAQLSSQHREVIVAVHLQGMTYLQLERHTGVPAATLRTRMFYGLKALKDVLQEEESHER